MGNLKRATIGPCQSSGSRIRRLLIPRNLFGFPDGLFRRTFLGVRLRFLETLLSEAPRGGLVEEKEWVGGDEGYVVVFFLERVSMKSQQKQKSGAVPRSRAEEADFPIRNHTQGHPGEGKGWFKKSSPGQIFREIQLPCVSLKGTRRKREKNREKGF
ncbi:hypothetical protein CEXT_639091 [Caerostris extrusa]|uniref:Uncharacterized protein n=1 Tax=Caerostris extrusa TaxID=172846 RepID=A0AAV4WL42_CAEEX|nr:hypothetical protein CEXT_639091 [Caerostris extrusa]